MVVVILTAPRLREPLDLRLVPEPRVGQHEPSPLWGGCAQVHLHPVSILLDEIHAATPSDFATKRFFYLLKAATEYGHQMVYTCNVTTAVLHRRWRTVNELEGDSIARRLAEYSKRIEMF